MHGFLMARSIVMRFFFKNSCKKVAEKIWWNQKNVVPLHSQMRNELQANEICYLKVR